MPSVLVVDNYTKRGAVDGLAEALTAAGARVTTVSFEESSPSRFGGFDGVVLSGSPVMLSEDHAASKYEKEIESARDSPAPVLGICFGHQLLGIAFGERVVKWREPIKRFVDNKVIESAPLFEGLPRTVSVFESHEEVVEKVPDGFTLLATSPSAPVATMVHRRLPILGTQFHPEKTDASHADGKAIVRNFVSGLG